MDPSRSSPGRGDATLLLHRLADGDPSAASDLLPLVYDQLRAIAGGQFRGQSPGHTLQPTALVHEAYLKLVQTADPDWNDRAHFCAVAATAMRQILQDHARASRAAKRGGGAKREPLDTIATQDGSSLVSLLGLAEALDKISALDERKARIIELRFFGGLTNVEIARMLGVSLSTIEKEWRHARAWMSRELSAEPLA